MPRHIRGKAQAKKDRAALRKLKSTGLYKGKIDLRKKPTASQQRLLRQFADVISGKAAVVTPKDPASYKSIFRVKGDKVIVPKRKGEKITVSKTGAIVGTRKVGSKTIRSKFRKVSRTETQKTDQVKMLALPFIRGRDKNGNPIVEWKRFPDRGTLQAILDKGYGTYADTWPAYVVEERVDAEHPYTVTEADKKRRARIEKRGLKHKRRIKFDDGDEVEE